MGIKSDTLDIPSGSFQPIAGATTSSYTFSVPLTQTTWFRRKVTDAFNNSIYSNIIKIQVVSVKWENLNYLREHDILKQAVTDWKTVDQLVIGDKLQSTTYLDGLGRPLQKVSRETATPATTGGIWGDVVQFSAYDAYGRQPLQYLPYTTTNAPEIGKYKSAPVTEQAQYYLNVYNETKAYSEVTQYFNDPLNRPQIVKSPGTSWSAGTGNSVSYDLNDATDNVQMFTIGYNTGDAPVNAGTYAVNTLFKTSHTDENGHNVIEYTNKSGQLILTKTQINDTPADAYTGWICVYSIYDDFGLLRYRLQPEAVKYLYANSWSFAATAGQQVLNELCFRYEYDDKGRNILKKAPGALPLNMIYDSRDRVVFMQDGNQSVKSPPEWTANLYDELDRPTITTLYETNNTIANLQSAVDNSTILTTLTIANPAAPVVSLVVDNRQTNVPVYSAQTSIEFVDGFASADNDAFVAQIDATTSQTLTVNSVAYKDPITSADLNNAAISTIIKYQFYDDYTYPGAKSFDTKFDNTTAYSTSDPNVIPIAPSQRTTSFPTGSMVRVLGTSTFLTSTEFYDEKGRHIQTIEDNIKSGKDVTTLQYHWDGRLLSSHSKHTTANSGYANFGIVTKNVFDKIGRINSVQKNYGSNGFKTIASYDFDDVGRLKTKHLDPGYTGSGKSEMEALAYSYNIHNNITGINKDYALKTAATYNKWNNFFGLYLGYDNKDLVFINKQLDGHVTGLLWNTQGDDAQRKYDYTYDDAGRLVNAVYKEMQTPNTTWDNSKMDFSVSGSGGLITYDLNGNLLSMLQKGVLPGSTSPATVDNLAYTYGSYTNSVYGAYSNKLTKVTDNGTLGSANGSFGDFKDGTNGTADDYLYDNNGNLVIDLNKNAKDLTGTGTNGISYNFLDKPEQIRISGKGTIKIVYDAEGTKLQKTYTPENGTAVTTTYINQYVYKGDSLQYINFEEGRIRVMQPISWNNGYDWAAIDGNMTLPNGKKGTFDYYIRDYQENVRMILTEESQTSNNVCTMETARASNETPYFGQAGTANEVLTTQAAKPPGWPSNTSSSVSQLSKLSGHTIGPNSLLKVMAGDTLNAKADYYYAAAVTNNNNSLVTDIVTDLVQAISGSAVTNAGVKGGTAGISGNLNGSLPFATAADPNKTTTDNIPRAYLNIMFFDERFNFVSENSAAVRVSQPGDGAAPLVLPANTKAPKNGYAYIYLSNENDQAIYFDNFQVSDKRGRIIEEDHYYAFGLKIGGISSTKLSDPNEGNINNKNLYNDKELIDEGDLNWYDYGFRNYDPQIGRFPQLDPLTDDYPELTNYQYASNEPVANIDIDGLEKGSAISSFLTTTTERTMDWFPKAATLATTTETVAKVGLSATSAALRVGLVVANQGLRVGLDGQKSLDIEKRLQVSQAKEIRRSWVSLGSNKSVNTVTGQIRYSTTSVESMDVVGTILLPIPKVGWALKLLGRGELTELELVTKAATKAERAIGGTGRFKGIAKHTYANKLLSRYQSIYGSRGFEFNQYFNNGVGNRGFLDVINHGSKTIFDYKFGSATMGLEQYLKYSRNFQGYSIQVIKP